MKNIIKLFGLALFITAAFTSCSDEEVVVIDPMIIGVCEGVESAVNEDIENSDWSTMLVNSRDQRIKTKTMQAFFAAGGYDQDDYEVENKAEVEIRIAEALAYVESKIDSVWDANITDVFNSTDPESPGISNLGLIQFNETNDEIDAIYDWLYEDTEDETEVVFTFSVLNVLKTKKIADLLHLNSLTEAEVTEYIQAVRDQYARMVPEYEGLETEVDNAPEFSKAQKELYASLATLLDEIGAEINTQILLSTKNKLDVIDRDLYALVYFVENNYTSPAQSPLVYGEISSITELRWFSEVATAEDHAVDWVITADIDAAETHRWNDGKGFLAIGEFKGTLDGQFHIISGIKTGYYNGTNPAFIGKLRGGEIKNLGFVNATGTVWDINHSAILVGYCWDGIFSKCFVDGTNLTRGQSGGFVGRMDGGTVTDCFSSVEITHMAANNMGGFMGISTDGAGLTLTNVYATGFITNPPSQNGAINGNFVNNLEKVFLTGVYYDGSTVGTIGAKPEAYEAQITNLPTADWNNLAKFEGYSSDVWEIMTIEAIDVNPRPYLKGFDYSVLNDMITPGE